MATDDATLVERLRRGDARAFDEVYVCFRPRLFSFLGRLGGQPALAEELMQETFLRLARHATELHENTQLGAWLFTVARNLYANHRRWARLDLTRLAELRLWSRLRGPAPSPFVLAASSETERRLEAALAALPTEQREVLLLVALEGMTPSEAAEVIGVHPAAARKRLSRARDMLRRELESLEPTP